MASGQFMVPKVLETVLQILVETEILVQSEARSR